MSKKFLKKIIAQSPQDLQMISAICSGAKVKLSEIKFLRKNKIFLLFLKRKNKENEKPTETIDSIVKFEFIESTKSKNIDQADQNKVLELLAIDVFKKELNYEIMLLFFNNAFITLRSEIIECSLENIKKTND